MNVEQAPSWLPTILIPFFTLSYAVPRPAAPDSFPSSNYYSTGLLDGCLVITYIAVMAALRDIARVFIMEPFAHWYLTRGTTSTNETQGSPESVTAAKGNDGYTGHGVGDLRSHYSEKGDATFKRKREERVIQRSVLRFAEQGWSMIYYSVQWSFGVYVHCNLPTSPLVLTKLWTNYPHTPLAGPLKLYYLTQTAFYTHQILILNAEARRKDHYQMMAHHIISIALMILSYFFNFTRIGCLIMVLMDYCDIFLPLAKMFRYLSLPTLCDVTFTWFLLSWLITRHIFFIPVIKSACVDGPRLIPFKWDPANGHFYPYEAYLVFMTLLISLQFIQMLWFGMICRVAWRVIVGQGATDTRSDEEGENDNEEWASSSATPPPSAHPDLKKRR